MKAKKIYLNYDEEGDFLEVSFGKIKDGYFREVKNKYFERIDNKSGKVVGYTIFNFNKRKEKFVDIELPIPEGIFA